MHYWQQRVVIEKAQLDEKIDKLLGFLHGDHFSKVDDDEQDRLRSQLYHMTQYTEALRQRINAFKE